MAAHKTLPSRGVSRQEHWSGLPFPSPMHESEKWKWSRSVMSDSSRPHGLQPTRLLRPWDFPGKSTGVGCYHLLRRTSLKVTKKEKNTRDEIFLLKAEKVPFTADVIEQLIKNLLIVISHDIVPYPYTFSHLPEDSKIILWSTLYSEETESDLLMKSCQ